MKYVLTIRCLGLGFYKPYIIWKQSAEYTYTDTMQNLPRCHDTEKIVQNVLCILYCDRAGEEKGIKNISMINITFFLGSLAWYLAMWLFGAEPIVG